MSLFKEQLNCPVCKTWLGNRLKGELFIGHCDECKTTFIWRVKGKIPEAHLDNQASKDKKCGCNICGR